MSAPLTDDDLAAIKARCDAATPGPWLVNDWQDLAVLHHEKERGYVRLAVLPNRAMQDAEFIAAARRDLPALLAEVARLREEAEERRAEGNRLLRVVGELSGELDRLRRR